MKRQILYITHEVMPGFGLPVGGGGIRCWSLGKGLEQCGHQVIYSLPENVVCKIPNPSESLLQYAHHPEKINEIILRVRPDIIMFQQWPSAYGLDIKDIPVVMDLHGSLLIENSFRQLGDFRTNALNKISILENVDYFICAGERQKWYWWSWLLMSGMDPKDIRLDIVPVSLSPELPDHQYPDKPVFVFGGVSWAWQDPSIALNAICESIISTDYGQLKIYVGKHPIHRIQGEVYNDLRQQVPSDNRIIFSEMINHEDLVKEYLKSSVAVDVMKKNTERELAFTTRTIEYLWCGLPVIYPDYHELSSHIKEYSAGWIVNPENEDEMKNVIKSIYDKPDTIKEFGRNAQKLVKDRFTWDKTILPLDNFCHTPVIRTKSRNIMHQSIQRIETLEQELNLCRDLNRQHQSQLDTMKNELNSVKHDLESIRNKPLFKIYKSMKKIMRME